MVDKINSVLKLPDVKLPDGCLYMLEDVPTQYGDRTTKELAQYSLSLARNLGGHPCGYCANSSCGSREAPSRV